MAASPADRTVARVFGGRVLCSATAPGAVSYDAQGTRFVFQPPQGAAPEDIWALDIEDRATPLPASVAAALAARAEAGTDALQSAQGPQPGQAWTALEVAAKLTDTPMHIMLRQRSVPTPAIAIKRADTEAYWIAVGRKTSLAQTEQVERTQV